MISSTGDAVNTTFCDPEQLETLTKPCELEPCVVFFWRARELTDCKPEDAAKLCGKVSLFCTLPSLLVLVQLEGAHMRLQ